MHVVSLNFKYDLSSACLWEHADDIKIDKNFELKQKISHRDAKLDNIKVSQSCKFEVEFSVVSTKVSHYLNRFGLYSSKKIIIKLLFIEDIDMLIDL